MLNPLFGQSVTTNVLALASSPDRQMFFSSAFCLVVRFLVEETFNGARE